MSQIGSTHVSSDTVLGGAPEARQAQRWDFLWLEITGRCQLSCVHCYANSGPTGSHGAMTDDDWCAVVDDAATLGVRMVQFIGGEPTTHPQFLELMSYALAVGLSVEVFTNLVNVHPSWWDLFAHPKVSLATSYYSDDADEHRAITGRVDSYVRTRTNIAEAVRRGIPLRAGVIGVSDGQRVSQARTELEALGVTDIGVDHLRQVGRGVRRKDPDAAELCGNCAQGVAAVSPEGDVWPCVFARWMSVGNVRRDGLATILTGPSMAATAAQLSSNSARDGRASRTCATPPVRPFL